ncbi:MAG: PAS domain-containing protein [Cytophagaceae bacterium]|nr:PAS domain-containing protein [Cytophagaceae bacterium]
MSKSSKNIGSMLCLDLYLASCSEEEQVKLSRKIKPANYKLHPLSSGDIYSSYMHQLAAEEKKKNDLQALLFFQKKANWVIELEQILQNDYYTLVLTDEKQIIQWVSKTFPAMTGYPLNFAIGKSPRFLQGENSSQETKKRIRQQLSFNKPFTETVINYKKNKQEYHCKVTIYPIANDKQEITHFLALESETIV